MHVDSNSQKLKVGWTFFLVGYGCRQSGPWVLDFTVSQGWTNGTKQMEFCCANSCKLTGDWKFFGGNGQKWVWPVWWWDSKTDYLKNEQMEKLFF